MNERIKELLEQSTEHIMGVPVVNQKRFAELIVQECAELVRIQNEQFMENESHYGVVSADILKHFGIKE
jgi:hypothetical protein